METEHQMVLPRRLQIEFSKAVQAVTEDTGTEISPIAMWSIFEEEYLPSTPHVELVSHETHTVGDEANVTAQLLINGVHRTVSGQGNGPIDAFVHALFLETGIELDVVDYSEHTMSRGSDASAVAYVETVWPNGSTRWGVGLHQSILTASLRAVVSAVNARL